MEKIKKIDGHVFYLSPHHVGEKERENTINVLMGDRGEGKTLDFVQYIIPEYFNREIKMNVVLSTRNKLYSRENFSFDWKTVESGVEILYASDFDDIKQRVKTELNCAWCFEDSKGLFDVKLDKDTRKCLIDSRMNNVDTYFMWQAWGWTCADVLRVMDTITVYPNQEDPKCRKDFLGQQELEILQHYTPQLKHRENYTIYR